MLPLHFFSSFFAVHSIHHNGVRQVWKDWYEGKAHGISVNYSMLRKKLLQVSRISLGCMSYGSSKWQSWVKDEEESLELIGKAYEAGINFFDTAESYSNGESERILGLAIKKFNMKRERIVVATKVYFPVNEDVSVNNLGMRPNEPHLVNCLGLSRKHIFDAVEGSLKRLGLDYIDLYQIHRFDPVSNPGIKKR